MNKKLGTERGLLRQSLKVLSEDVRGRRRQKLVLRVSLVISEQLHQKVEARGLSIFTVTARLIQTKGFFSNLSNQSSIFYTLEYRVKLCKHLILKFKFVNEDFSVYKWLKVGRGWSIAVSNSMFSSHLTHSVELLHPEQEFTKLAGHVRVVVDGVLLQRVQHLLLTHSHRVSILQTTRIYKTRSY